MIGEVGADISLGAGAVLDDDRLAPFAREWPVSDQPRNGIRRAADDERNDDPDGAVRIVLRAPK